MAAILLADVRFYSKMRNDRQQQVAQALNEHCLKVLLPAFRRQRLNPAGPTTIAAMPTGDGIVVCLESTEDERNPGLTLLRLAISLQELVRSPQLTDGSEKQRVQFRMGIHTGTLETIEDVNLQRNFCGHAINVAQRIMDVGEADHIICSEDAFNSYFSGIDFLEDAPEKVEYDHLPGGYRDKHDVQLDVRNIFRKGDRPFGNAVRPLPKRDFKLLSPQHEELLRNFRGVNDLVVIGITNLEFVNALVAIPDYAETPTRPEPAGAAADRGATPPGGANGARPAEKPPAPTLPGDAEVTWTKIRVYFPTVKQVRFIPTLDEEKRHDKDYYVRQRNEHIERLRAIHEGNSGVPNLRVLTGKFELYEYDFPPAVGIIAGDHDLPSGRIQVNYYLWGAHSLKPTLWSMTVILDDHSDENYQKFNHYVKFVEKESKPIPTEGGARPTTTARTAPPDPPSRHGRAGSRNPSAGRRSGP